MSELLRSKEVFQTSFTFWKILLVNKVNQVNRKKPQNPQVTALLSNSAGYSNYLPRYGKAQATALSSGLKESMICLVLNL